MLFSRHNSNSTFVLCVLRVLKKGWRIRQTTITGNIKVQYCTGANTYLRDDKKLNTENSQPTRFNSMLLGRGRRYINHMLRKYVPCCYILSGEDRSSSVQAEFSPQRFHGISAQVGQSGEREEFLKRKIMPVVVPWKGNGFVLSNPKVCKSSSLSRYA